MTRHLRVQRDAQREFDAAVDWYQDRALRGYFRATLISTLRNKSVRRIGEVDARALDLRLIFATTHVGRCPRELLLLVKTRLKLPPLRTRLADLPLHLERLGARGVATPTKKSWRGNDDELEAELDRLAEEASSGSAPPDV